MKVVILPLVENVLSSEENIIFFKNTIFCLFFSLLKIKNNKKIINHQLLSFPFMSWLFHMVLILYWRSSISLLIISILVFFIYISPLSSSSLGSFLLLLVDPNEVDFLSSSEPRLLLSYRISSLNELISLIRATFSFIILMFSCLWISESFWRFFFNIAMDFYKYFFWFLYSFWISESILAWTIEWDTNLSLS